MIRDTNFIESTEHNIRDANRQRSKLWRLSFLPPPSHVNSPQNPIIILMLLVNLKVILEKHGKPLTNLLPIAPTIQR